MSWSLFLFITGLFDHGLQTGCNIDFSKITTDSSPVPAACAADPAIASNLRAPAWGGGGPRARPGPPTPLWGPPPPHPPAGPPPDVFPPPPPPPPSPTPPPVPRSR